jgi:hypothetical protein
LKIKRKSRITQSRLSRDRGDNPKWLGGSLTTLLKCLKMANSRLKIDLSNIDPSDAYKQNQNRIHCS